MNEFIFEEVVDEQNKILYKFKQHNKLISLISYQKSYRKKLKLTWNISKYWDVTGLGNLLKEPYLEDHIIIRLSNHLSLPSFKLVSWETLKQSINEQSNNDGRTTINKPTS